MKYNEMKNTILKKEALLRGIEFKDCKNPSKPNNQELIALLEKYDAEQGNVDPIENEGDGSIPEIELDDIETPKQDVGTVGKIQDFSVENTIKKSKKMTDRQALAYLNTVIKVIVHDTSNAEVFETDTDDLLFPVSISNGKIRARTEFVRIRSHEPQGITRLALIALQDIHIPSHQQVGPNKVGATMVPRFNIQEVPGGFTKVEVDALREKKLAIDAQATRQI